MIVIRCIELTGVAGHPSNGSSPRGLFLKAYDPEAFDGRGWAEWGTLDEAMKFSTSGEAWMLWRGVSMTRPVRADGAPNRPLTAFTIEVADEAVYSG
jgi:hypothetical protein